MKLNICRTQHVLALLTMYLRLVHSWDIAVGVGDKLRFYTNHTETKAISFASQNLTALTYNDVSDRIIYVDKQANNDAICHYTISSNEYFCSARTGRNIHGMAYDPVTDKIFFTDTNERTVNWFSFNENNPRGNLLIKMDEGIPRDIAVDSCKGYVYWMNTDMAQPTIERVRFDGTEREVFANISLVEPDNSNESQLEPHSLAIDQQTQTIYWLEPAPSYATQLHLSALNKNYNTAFNRDFRPDLLMYFHPSNTLTVSNRFLYSLKFTEFSGPCIYEQSKTPDFNNPLRNPDTATSLRGLNIPPQMPVAIVANYKIADQIQGRQDCEGLRRKIKIPTEYDATFCVYGVKVNGQSVCKCSPGYIGERCDVSICENYCLHGNCSVNNEELPECRCDAGYSGVRCDVSVCENYCLQGNCSVNNEELPECRCDAGYSGVRCEINSCHGYCLNGGDCTLNEVDDPVCQCVGSYVGTRCEVDKSEILSTTSCSEAGDLTLSELLSRKPFPKKILIC